MKKIVLFLLILINTSRLFTLNQVTIGITSPYLRDENAETMFFHKHFTFELLFNYNDEEFLLEIINIDEDNNEGEYLKLCKKEVIIKNYDYLLFSTVDSNKNSIFFKVQLLNPYTDKVVFSKIFINKTDFTINESLSENTIQVLNKILELKLEKSEGKKIVLIKEKKNKDNKKLDEFDFDKPKGKHEIFILNGFFKNHVQVNSFLEFCTGYNFSPFDFFSVEGAMFIGGGYLNKSLSLVDINVNNFYIGGYAAFYLYLSGIIEPSIGLRFEIIYVHEDSVYFTFPIDVGLKIKLAGKNYLRINSSFQFICYDFTEGEYGSWVNNFIIGFSVGYARKI